MSNLTNSTRQIPKATYVPLKLSATLPDTGRAIPKFGYVRQLNLQLGEVEAVQKSLALLASLSSRSDTPDANFWSLVKQFEGSPLPSQLPAPSAFANTPENELIAFGKALAATRSQAVQRLQQPNAANLAIGPGIAPAAGAAQSVASALNLLNTASVANNVFSSNVAAQPVGMLNLERLEMTPAGLERGELLATIPLAPKERTGVVQKEWSVTTQEFTSIVTDSLENYSETGVTENTELAASTNSQVSHNNQFNINSTASGSYAGFVSGSTAVTFGTQDQSSLSAKDSRTDAVQTTRKASSRVKQSHKMTISTTTVTGTSETTTRMLENPSATDPIRIDYFSLMRKWYVGLYRYGLRLTYDIGVPEPGAAMRGIYEQLAKLQAQAAKTFTFAVAYSDITQTNYQQLAATYGAQVPPPPKGTSQTVGGTSVTGIDTGHPGNVTIWPLNFTVPDGTQISQVFLNSDIGNNTKGYNLSILGYPNEFDDPGDGTLEKLRNSLLNGFLVGFTGSLTITSVLRWANPAVVEFTVQTVPTADSLAQWQASVYNALYNAAQTTFYTQQQSINAQISALQNQIGSVDTLTLRREENDEIMKCVLQWLLGPGFDFMPAEVIALYQGSDALTYGVAFTGNDINLGTTQWTTMFMHQEMIKFINEAIEWESVAYFLYSYFWDVPPSWSFIRQIQHPDSTRQAFLRAGSARVVLTVRPGFEQAWTSFVELGDFGSVLDKGHPYLTIAQQIQAYDSTNYPGIPPANPNGGGPDDDAPQVGTTCSTGLSIGETNIPVADSTGFVVGATAIIDNWDAGINPTTGVGPGGFGIGAQETQTITAVTAHPPSITVQPLKYPHGTVNGPFPIVQAGAKGVLIAEWYEYTPTSGTDIAVTTNLASTRPVQPIE